LFACFGSFVGEHNLGLKCLCLGGGLGWVLLIVIS